MIVLVCGSRYWSNREVIERRLAKLPADSVVIQGECRGADLVSRSVALGLGFDVIGFPANWNRHGPAAGPIRNLRMLKEKPDLVIAFSNDLHSSKGTKHMVESAKKAGVKAEVISEEDEK